MKSITTLLALTFSVMFSSVGFAHSPYYQLFVISVEKGFHVDASGSISNKSIFKGITQFETSNLGGGKFPTKEKCLEFLKNLVMERGGSGRGYQMTYKDIMIEDTGDGYHTERHCVLMQ